MIFVNKKVFNKLDYEKNRKKMNKPNSGACFRAFISQKLNRDEKKQQQM